jgi:hypothetical protein
MAELIRLKQIESSSLLEAAVAIAEDLEGAVQEALSGSTLTDLTLQNAIVTTKTDDQYSLVVSGAVSIVDWNNVMSQSIDNINRAAVSASLNVQRVGTLGTTSPVQNSSIQNIGVIDLGGFF